MPTNLMMLGCLKHIYDFLDAKTTPLTADEIHDIMVRIEMCINNNEEEAS
jgi:hypothetical protein